MATENVVSKKYRILSDVVNKVWDVISFFTLAKDVETTNGNNLETTCGSITGITSSLTSTSTTMAASASAIKQLNDKIADLNSNLSKHGTFSGTSTQHVDCGFEPTSITIIEYVSDTLTRTFVYNASFSTNKVACDDGMVALSSSKNVTTTNRLYVDSTGFYYLPNGGSYTAHYYASK